MTREKIFGLDRASLLSLLGLMLAGAWVRIAGLPGFYLSPDEGTIMAIAREPDLAAVFRGMLVQAHPPFHFFLMHFWPNPGNSIMWLRVSSLLPGLLFIPVCWLLGRKALGPLAAWALAFFAAFGNAPMTLSEVIRPYALLGLFFAVALWFWFDLLEQPRRKNLAGYAATITAALAFHYSAGLFIAATGIAGATWLIIRRRSFRDLSVFCATHLPAALTGALLYWLHLSRIPKLQRSWMEGYLRIGFPESARDLVHHFNTVLFYFFFEPLAPVFALLCLAGIVALILRRRWTVLLLVGACLAVGLALNLTGIYPLYGLRHSYWLYPAFAFLAAAPFELLDRQSRQLAVYRAGRILGSHAPTIVLPLAALITLRYAHHDYLRLMYPTREAEFSITQEFFDGLTNWFDQKTTPDDLILATLQTADLLRFVAEPGADRPISPNLSALRFRGREYIYAPKIWNYKNRGQLGDTLREALRLRPVRDGNSVIITNFGYGCEAVLFATDSLFQGSIASGERTTADYLFIMRLPVSKVRPALE